MMNAKRWKWAGAAALAAALVLLFAVDALWYLELKLTDAVFQRPSQTDPDIVVVGIDDYALERFGRYQDWSRELFAEAIGILNSDPDAQPAVILLDVLFTESGADPLADAALADAARRAGNVITAAELRYGQDRNLNKTVAGVNLPFPALAEVSAYGLANGSLDRDGHVRHALLWDEFEGQRYYSFAAQVYFSLHGEYGDLAERNREMYIPYYGAPGDYYQWSLAELFDPDFDPAFFEDCVVMIGAFTTGMMDAYYTPADPEEQMNGVEIHANAIQALLEGNFKRDVPRPIRLAGFLLVTAAAFALIGLLSVRAALLACAGLAAAQTALSVWLYDFGFVYMLLYPLLAVALIYLYKVVYSYVTAVIEKQRVRGVFMKYVDPALVDRLIESGEADSNEVGVVRDIAVMFVDVRGFTPMTEALKDRPEVVVQILNEYLELTSAAVFDNGGSVDKFIGDATMALFNGFVPLDDYVYKAVKAARDMVCGAARVNASVKEKYGVDIGFGVGVHCGGAIVGNLGPAFRKDFTAIGDTVNTAARLESNALRSQVLISRAVCDRLEGRLKAVSIGEIPLKGKSERLEVFAVDDIE